MTLIFFTGTLPSPLVDELARQGNTVYEVLAVSEVLHLAEQYPAATIIVNHDVEPAAAKAIQQHYPTITLKPIATIKDVL